MTEHALYCIDSPAASQVATADHLAGWLLCSRKIGAITCREPGVRVSYNLDRPDVAQAYDLYPDAALSGFRAEFPTGLLTAQDTLELVLQAQGGFGRKKSFRLRLDLASNDTQQTLVHERNPYNGLPPETLESRLQESLAAKPGLTFRLDIVNKCNLRCVFCKYSEPGHAQRPLQNMTADELKVLFEDIGPIVRNVVLSCTDEPLTSRYFPDILSYLADEHPHVDIAFCTNATLMKAKIRHLLIEKGVSHLFLSMDGVRKATLESIRVGAKYERVVANILALNDLKRASGCEHPTLIMNYVMMNENIHEAHVFVEAAARLGAELIDFRHVIPNEYVADPQQYLVNHKAKYNYFWERIRDAAKRHKIAIDLPPAYATTDRFDPREVPAVDLRDFESIAADPAPSEVPIPRKFPQGYRTLPARGTAADVFSRTYCERPFSEILLADQEVVKPCPWYQGELGRLSEGKTLSEIFHGPRFQELRRNMLRPEADPGCHMCPQKADQVSALVARHKSATGSKLRRLVRRVSRILQESFARFRRP